MRSVKNPSLFLLSCLAVVICFSMLAPARPGRMAAVSPVSNDSSDTAGFGAAAGENARLKLDLNWTFGAKPQRGWYLYTPLIQSLLNTIAAPETSAFGQALAGWQRSE